jgi:hypothetical protein
MAYTDRSSAATAFSFGHPATTATRGGGLTDSGSNSAYGAGGLTGDLTGANRDAATALTSLFNSYGLGTLAPQIIGFLKNGYSADTVSILLQETPEYKARFAANAAREKAGLPVLSPAQYLSTENSYRQIMQSAGLPPGFYDQPKDFQKFLEMDVSPTEVQTRVTDASNFINSASPQALQAFKQFYTQGDLIAYALDPEKASPLVGKQFAASQIAGAATSQGLGVDKTMAEQLAGQGINQSQASQGFSLIASEQDNANKMAALSGQTGFTTNDLVNETFNNSASVTDKRAKLASQERGRFGGSSGVTGSSLVQNGGGSF